MYVFDDDCRWYQTELKKQLLVRIGLMANHVNVILIG